MKRIATQSREQKRRCVTFALPTLVLVTAFVVSPPSAIAQDNLLANGSFENPAIAPNSISGGPLTNTFFPGWIGTGDAPWAVFNGNPGSVAGVNFL